jgi:DNA-binding response OmpR family regulator
LNHMAVETEREESMVGERSPLVQALAELNAGLVVSQRVLLVDGDERAAAILAEAFSARGLRCDRAGGAEEAEARLGLATYAVVVLDLDLPGLDGLELLRRIRAGWPRTELLLVTGDGSLTGALEALALGAFDFISKPLPSVDQLVERIRAALSRHDFEERVHALIDALDKRPELLGRDRAARVHAGIGARLRAILDRLQGREEEGLVLVLGPATMARVVLRLGYGVSEAATLAEATRALASGSFHVVLLVEESVGIRAAEAVDALRRADPEVGVFVVGPERDQRALLEAIGAGVGEVLLRPLEGRELLAPRLERLMRRRQRTLCYRDLIETLREIGVDLLSALA